MRSSNEPGPKRLGKSLDALFPDSARALLPAGAKNAVRAILGSKPMRVVERLLERRDDRRYAAGKRVVSAAEIKMALGELPLPEGAVVFVHSSMSRLGFVEGGAETVVAAMTDLVVGERHGTIAAPTFTMVGGMADTLRADLTFDVRETPSGTGRITELLRRRPDARRSLHPTHSVAAVGPRADWLVADHHRDARAFGPPSPFARLIEANGFVLGLGVDLGPVTFYHTIEDLGPFPFRVYTKDSPLIAVCIDQQGRRVEFPVMAHDPAASTTRIDRPNGTAIRAYLTGVFENSAGLTWHGIGDGRMWLASARQLYDCLDHLKGHGVTIYATAEEVAAFPPADAVLGEAIG